jgi:hypothetical protein
MLISAMLIAALTALASPARADDPPIPSSSPSPTPKATSTADRIIRPLREIGRVRARTPYCGTLLRSGTQAAETVIAFELARITLSSDLRDAQFTDGLHKSSSMRLLQFDLAHMYDLIRQGRAELNDLRALAGDDDEKASALQGLRDALDGVKSRQLEQLRSFARVIGTLEEHPVTLPASPADDKASDPETKSAASRVLDPFEDTFTDRYELAEYREIFRAAEQDDLIKNDMIRAGDDATHALALGNCATE